MHELSASFTQELDSRWRLTRLIGEGGMAAVYLADDLRHARPVAVKVMRPGLVSADTARRFSQEILVTARLRHPNILPLLDSGVADDTPYYIMPFVNGGSLRARIDRDGALPVDVAVQILSDVADALDYAHAEGVVHRDIKPENILLESDRAVVADFGIAHAVNQVSDERLTATGIALGTPSYMSPEQNGQSRVDARSDLYSLGCVAYEMLAGHAPFAGRTLQELLARHALDSVPPLRSARPSLPEALDRTLAKALAKSPADRYQTGRAFARALADAVRGETPSVGFDAQRSATTMHIPVAVRDKQPVLRPRWRRWAVTAATLASVTAVAILAWRSNAHAAFGSRDWIVVADVAGDTADAIVRQALRDALTVALQQSRYVNVEPPETVMQTIRMMGRPDTTHLTESVAREVALRQQARVVLIPGLTRLDSTYLVTARVISSQNGADVFTVRERAAGRAKVLDALDRVALDVRQNLGERLRDAAPPMKLERATTQSLDALATWTRGNDHFRNANYAAAAEEYARAIALDSNFAMAHRSLGITLYWLNRSLEGDTYFERALALRDRLTDRERLIIEADIANWRRQTDAAVSLYQRVLLEYPDDLTARRSLGYTLLRAGRCGDALEPYEWLRRHDSTTFAVRVNLATCYSMLRRYPEALREYGAAFTIRPTTIRTGDNVVQEYAQTLMWAGRTPAAESLITEQLQGDIQARARAHRGLALLRQYRGQSAAARELFRQAISEDRSAATVTSLLRDEMFLIRAFSDVGQLDSARLSFRDALEHARHERLDPEWLEDLATLGMRLGQKSEARDLKARVLSALRQGNGNDDFTRQLLEGEMALLEGDLSSARQHYDLAVSLRRLPKSLFGAARVARAQQRRADAEKLFAEVVADRPELSENYATLFEARLALGQLAADRGDSAAAKEHLGWIMTQWAAGDSDLMVRRDAARALAALHGKTN